MMLDLAYTAKFKRDVRTQRKRGADLSKLDAAILSLRKGEALPPNMRDHALSGVYRGHRECHIQPDWLLIYRIDEDALILTAVRTGSHSDLFDL